jgi:hypothetical protein
MKMPLSVVKDDREFFALYRSALREQSRLPISIHNVPHRRGEGLQAAIQDLFSAEVIKLAHDTLRTREISEDLLDETGLRSSLDGTSLPAKDRRILEAKIRQLARQTMLPGRRANGGREPEDAGDDSKPPTKQHADSGTIQQASHTAGQTCICMASGVPGETLDLSGLNPLPTPPTGQNFITVAVIFVANPPGKITDTLELKVEDGGPFGLGSSEMLVGLASKVSWAKEIVSWNLCRGRLSSVFQAQASGSPNFMQLERGCDGADTILFNKPFTLGFWGTRANFDFQLFWTVFGGKRLTFTWVTD